MDSLSLEFDTASGALLIRAVPEPLARHPLFAGFLRHFGGTITAEGSARIPTKEDELSARYQAIRKILEPLGYVPKVGEVASSALEGARDEEARFQVFSRRARDIWHGHVEPPELGEFVRIVQKTCPGRTLYRKQLLAAYHLAFSQNACNFSVPGAGKTSIVYAAYAFLKNGVAGRKPIDRLLVVGPLSSFKAWEDEFTSIFQRRPKSQRISGAMPPEERAHRLRGIVPDARDVEVTLTSYATLASSEADFSVFLRQPKSTMMVLDEAHYIKRDDGVWAAAALRLAAFAQSRIVLTGTPAPNGYEDLSNLFKFIYPTKSIIGFQPGALRAMTDGKMRAALGELKERIQPFYTRIKKADLGLPEVVERQIDVPLTSRHEEIYRGLERKIVPQLRQAMLNDRGPVRVRAKLIRLRQAAANPELLARPIEDETLFDNGTDDFSIAELEIAELVRGFEPGRDLERLRICRNLVREAIASQGKVLVWSYFLGNVARLRAALSDLAPFIGVLTGSTPVSGEEDEAAVVSRERIIDRFHRLHEPAILIANPQAVGESISLHRACRTAIYFDRDFNAGRFMQSKDRIHRYRPDKGEPVTYFYLASPTTVDSDIHQRLSLKEARLLQLLESDDIPLFTADLDERDDLRVVLESYEKRKIQ